MRSNHTRLDTIRSFKHIRHLRKIKLFVQVNKITLVAYYKNYTGTHDEYVGRAHTVHLKTLTHTSVALSHTNHSPPKSDEQKGKDALYGPKDEETMPIGIGAALLTA